ncbi:MAG: MBL fold metallo-hydrolase [Acidobacteriota bacterium]
MRAVPRILRVFLALLAAGAGLRAADELKLYFIDVEGGQATLLVTPSGQSLLIDAGYDGFGGRDAVRIKDAAKAANIKNIDYLLITHFHSDHVGGVTNLLQALPVGTFLDHGASIETGEYPAEYAGAFAKGKHQVVAPGDKIPLKNVSVTIVAGAGKNRGAVGEPNRYCEGVAPRPEEAGENNQSLALLVEFGKFRFLDPGDLTYNRELELLCPRNQVGQVDLMLSTHHGSESPKAIWGLAPRVVVMNNGPRKGADGAGWKNIKASPGLEDLWQLHFAMAGGSETNSPDVFLANLGDGGDADGKRLNVVATADGAFSITNSRNRYSKRYAAK